MLLEAANASATAAAAVAAAELEEGAEPPPRWRLTAHPNGTGGDATAPFLFIGVLSVPKSRVRRQAVRDTWMREAGANVAVRFMLYEVTLLFATTLSLSCCLLLCQTTSDLARALRCLSLLNVYGALQ